MHLYLKYQSFSTYGSKDIAQVTELQIIFYFKEYLPPDFEIKGYFAV
jgi:hypothetical protein